MKCEKQNPLVAGDAFAHPQVDIAGTVASITESEPGRAEMKQARETTPVLTGTAPRGGHGVWMFSLKWIELSFACEGFVNREAVPAFKIPGITAAMVGV